ncbi:MAG: AI-2E family transporter [Sphingomonadaceae bacterium]
MGRPHAAPPLAEVKGVAAAAAEAADAAASAAEAVADLAEESEAIALRRDRLLSGLVLVAAIGLFLAAPFALKAGSAFFLPVTLALVVAVILIPPHSWLERRGLPSGLAAALALAGFVLMAALALVAIIVPAIEFLTLLPDRLTQVRANLQPLLDTAESLGRFVQAVERELGVQAGMSGLASALPENLYDLFGGAPAFLGQMLFALVLVYFFLNAFSRLRERRLRHLAETRLARLGRAVVDNTAGYMATVTLINAGVGVLTALIAWAFGLPTPAMWGGMAALFNFIPYVGPVIVALLLLLGGLISFASPLAALGPALAFAALHAVEANVVTPSLISRRVTLSPLAILIALSFWGWVWGPVGALLSVPLLIMMKLLLDHAGTPDISGFLFREGTLVRRPVEEDER